MEKKDLITLFGTQVALAKALGISKSAVGQWKQVPRLQQYRLREIRPNIDKELAALQERV